MREILFTPERKDTIQILQVNSYFIGAELHNRKENDWSRTRWIMIRDAFGNDTLHMLNPKTGLIQHTCQNKRPARKIVEELSAYPTFVATTFYDFNSFEELLAWSLENDQ